MPESSPKAAVLAFEGMSPFHLSVPCMVLGERFGGALPRYEVTVCAERPGRVETNAGFGLHVDADLRAMESAELVVVPSWAPERQPSPSLVDAVRSAHSRGATIVGLCLGAFVVATTGIADGREVVTHWAWAHRLAESRPGLTVRAHLLWLDHGGLTTSAGTAAAIDCCLHLVRRRFGAETATWVARAIVTAPHRSGSQAQFIPMPVPDDRGADPIESAMVWARTHLAEPLSVDEWATSAAMSRRSFTRQFRARTGLSAQRWLVHQRLDHARLLLETTDDSIERIAHECGFSTGDSLRRYFREFLGTTPRAHRSDFRERHAGVETRWPDVLQGWPAVDGQGAQPMPASDP